MSRKVLVVEDEIIVADDLEWKLRNLGYDVIGIVASGEEALIVVDREHPEVVMMDIQLQGKMNGVDAAKLIRRRSGTHIVFITAFPAVLLRDANEQGFPGLCVSKPFSTLQLKTALQSIAPSPDHRKTSTKL